MKRKTKRLLGVFGLAAVMVTTAIAYALPTPEAHAEGDIQNSADMTIQVKVVGPGSTLKLEEPANDAVLKSNRTTVRYTYQNMKSVTTYLSCVSTATVSDGIVAQASDKVINELTTSAGNESGENSFPVDLAAYGVTSDSTCRIFLTGKGINDTDVKDEGVQFEYRAMRVDIPTTDVDGEEKPITDEKGDPEVTIGVRDDVYSLLLQAYDAAGNPVFVKADGAEEPIIVGRDEFDLATGTYKLNLPMSKYGAKSGWYDLVAIAYGQDGKEVISMNTYRFYYDPGTPNVPGTGTIMDNLNISRADYVVTGLIAFGAVAMFGVYLVARKSRR